MKRIDKVVRHYFLSKLYQHDFIELVSSSSSSSVPTLLFSRLVVLTQKSVFNTMLIKINLFQFGNRVKCSYWLLTKTKFLSEGENISTKRYRENLKNLIRSNAEPSQIEPSCVKLFPFTY